MEAPRQVRVEVERPRCPYCHEQVATEARKSACEACLAWHHQECWEEHGGCSGCGRGRQVAVKPRPPATDAAPRAGIPELPLPDLHGRPRCLRGRCLRPALGRGLCERHTRLSLQFNAWIATLSFLMAAFSSAGALFGGSGGLLFLAIACALASLLACLGALENRRWLRRAKRS